MALLWPHLRLLLSTILIWPDLSIRLVITPAHRQWRKRFFSPNDNRSESRPVVVVVVPLLYQRLQYNTALSLHTRAPYHTGLLLLLSPKVGCFWQAVPVEDQPWRPFDEWKGTTFKTNNKQSSSLCRFEYERLQHPWVTLISVSSYPPPFWDGNSCIAG